MLKRFVVLALAMVVILPIVVAQELQVLDSSTVTIDGVVRPRLSGKSIRAQNGRGLFMTYPADKAANGVEVQFRHNGEPVISEFVLPPRAALARTAPVELLSVAGESCGSCAVTKRRCRAA